MRSAACCSACKVHGRESYIPCSNGVNRALDLGDAGSDSALGRGGAGENLNTGQNMKGGERERESERNSG